MKHRKEVIIGVIIVFVLAFGITYLAVSGVYALVCMAISRLEFSWFHSLVITLVLMILSSFFKSSGGRK